MESTLKEKIKQLKLHDAKPHVENIVFTREEDIILEQLTDLGFVNTKQYNTLRNKKYNWIKDSENKKLKEDIKFLESHGFKVLNGKFLYEFRQKYNLDKDISKRYIFDIPSQNLENINKKIEDFLKIAPKLKKIIGIENRKISKKALCKKFLQIIAPKEHFNKNIPLIDPDPIAVLKLDKEYYLYLDAWDLEKIMFDNETNNPELLN